MIHALDTNTISFLLRPSRNQEVVQRFNDMVGQGGEYVIPPLCYYEIFWHLLRKDAKVQLQVFERLYNDSFQNSKMREADFILAAKLKANLVEKGTPIGNKDADIFIAAYCLNNGYTLVTDNTNDFERIEGLQVINWKQ